MNKKERLTVCILATLIVACISSAAAICISYDNKVASQNTEVSETVTEKLNNGWKMSDGRYKKDETEISETEFTEISEETTEITEISSYETSFEEITSTTFEQTETTEISSETEITEISDTSQISDTEISETSDIISETEIPQTTVPVTETVTMPVTSAVKISNPIPQSAPVDKSYLDDAVFVGDSIFEGLSLYKFFPEKQVFASVGLNPYQLNSNTIDTYYGNVTALSAVISARPSKVYIMMGMNGVAWDINNDMSEQIGIFIDHVKQHMPSVKIYLMSVTPVSAEREAKPSTAEGKILNSQIDKFNKCLLELADEKEIYYLDVNSSLRGSNGCLPSNLTSDGIHISKPVYEDIIEYILSHTVQ